ncbi:hypothetical protein [Rossellomorea arthrocnemi]|uniref:hypothetical protein n=1 Tax=Rossellomorea arthrocnemi TaxID=2769542 RepID=UPI001919C829|nr:hypothetical protein [Rossellomorea arthrocnemi]
MNKIVLYWRIVFIFALVLLFLFQYISLSIFLATVVGIIFFYGIPSLANKLRQSKRE